MSEAVLVMLALGAVVLGASALAWLTPLADSGAPERYRNLDGLRALCALAVMLPHGKALYNLHFGGGFALQDGIDPSLSHWASLGVSMFFQITGFLFWGKVLACSGALDIPRHLQSRLRRLVPAYLVFGVAALCLALARSNFELRTDSWDLARAVLGTFSFGFMDVRAFNQEYVYWTTISITWTLAYEWGFYLALPGLALLYRRGATAVIVIGYVLYQFAFPTQWIVANFAAGMLVAASLRRGSDSSLTGRSWPPVILLLALPALVLGFVLWQPLLEIPALGVCLRFAVSGHHLDRLLQQRGLALIGKVSYSVYLFHSLLIFHALWLLRQMGLPQAWGAEAQWLTIALMSLGVVAFSAGTYRLIERRYIMPAAAAPAAAAG